MPYRTPPVGFGLVLSVLAILVVTLAPFDFRHAERLPNALHYFEQVGTENLLEPVLNILLFVPLGFFIARSLRRFPDAGVLLAGLLGAGLSLGIEVLQVALPDRHPSLRDVLMNGTGSLIGALAWVRWYRTRYTTPDPPHPRRRLATILAVYAGIALLSGLLGRRDPGWSLANWDTDYPLVLANEATGDRPWHGTMCDVVLVPYALDPPAAVSLLASLTDPAPVFAIDQAARFRLTGPGPYADVQANLPALAWHPFSPPPADGCLRFEGTAWLRSLDPPRRFTEAAQSRSAFTLGIIATPAHLRQSGPARLVSLSINASLRNLTVGQDGTALVVRIRTPRAGPNGTRLAWRLSGFFDADTSVAFVVSYDTGRLTVYDQRRPGPRTTAITPEMSILSSLPMALGLGSIVVDLAEPMVPYWTAAYYLLVFGLTGLLLAPLWQLQEQRVRRRRLALLIAILPLPLLGWLSFHPDALAFGPAYLLSVAGLLPGAGLALRRRRPHPTRA